MTVVRVKGVKRFRHKRTGIWYTYHRASGACLEPPHAFGTPAFFAALASADAKHKAKGPVSGTFGAMMRSYRESPDFQTLKDRTKSDYHKVFDWLQGIDEMPVAQMDTQFIAKLRDKAFKQRKRRFANYVLSVVSVIFSHGIEHHLAKANPVRDVKKVRRPTDAPIANRAWTEDEKHIVLDAAPAHLIAPIAIARWTGLREGDIIRLGKTAYQDGSLNLTTSKRGVPHWFPCPRMLREILEAIPEHEAMRLCVNSRGLPWTPDGFRASFFKLIRKLEAEGRVAGGLTFHGLRTSFAEEAAGQGFNSRQIADALAQRDTKSAEHYTRNVDRRRSAKAISASLDGGNSGQGLSTKVSTLRYRSRKKELTP
jgi:integrase